jgi:hypothetical protein
MVAATSSRLPEPARNAAITNGTLIVDHATPVDQLPNDVVPTPPAAATATPTVAGRPPDKASKLLSSGRFTLTGG